MMKAKPGRQFKNFNVVYEDHTGDHDAFTERLNRMLEKYPNAQLVAVWRIEAGEYRLFFSEEL